MDPIKEVKNAFPTGKFIVSVIISFIVLNFVVDALINFVPGVGSTIAAFITKPFSFVKSKVSKPAA